MSGSVFALADARVAYGGVEVLRGVTLTIDAGERVALIGKSGAGKSSLLRLLHAQRRERTALVPQDLGLVRTLSVFHNIYMGRLAHHSALYNIANLVRPLPREVAAVRTLTEALDLSEKLFAPAGSLSGGQQQRVAVGRALHFGGDALLADEPVSALDPQRTRDVLRMVIDRHPTVVIAMHDIPLLLELATRVIGIADGRVVLDAPTAGLPAGEIAPFVATGEE
ncbi:MAG: ATP-binding cassette domain-containing protein [Alphaproteobacteria bacterium]